MPVLIQYAYDDGPITLYEIWTRPVRETLELIESFLDHNVIGFNLAFDWFHLSKLYTVFRLLEPDALPVIDEVARVEAEGRDGPFIKPTSCLDLMLHSRKGPYQSLMSRKPIRVKRVPTPLAYALAHELEQRVKFDDIYFARSKDGPRWKVHDRTDKWGEVDPNLKDVMLSFNPAGGLKYLAEHALGYSTASFDEIEPPGRPDEVGYAPFYPHSNWPDIIGGHIEHWARNAEAREYATNDIVYTRALYEHFKRPTSNDDDSVLACMVASVRWRGFVLDIPSLNRLRCDAAAVVDASPINTNKPTEVRAYITEVMSDLEKLALLDTRNVDIDESTKKENLEVIAEWGEHPAAVRAREILAIKVAAKEVELYDKLLTGGRFHASFSVIGARSSRMSGSGGDLNPQGIKSRDDVRGAFPLAEDGYTLSGGDFGGYEVCIADAVYGDEKLNALLRSDKKVHGVFATKLYPDKTYEEISATKGTENDLYTNGKRGVFGLIYFGEASTLENNLRIPREHAEAAYEWWNNEFPGIGETRAAIVDRFGAMTQPGGIGTAIEWTEPEDYIESMLGDRRYFTLENTTARTIFELASKPPKHWRRVDVKVTRFDRVQTAAGAVSSALYGAAFAIVGANTRAAGNHLVQSPGARITKRVQRRVWDLQPVGVHVPVVMPLNVHDELMVPNTCPDELAKVVRSAVESYRPDVPLIEMDWFKRMDNWAQKKAGEEVYAICP